ncbi:hypothetical protein CYMTET_36819 [Cymbomonas tetramitiformis]|uniref:Uncharacterized protein n=1 Tax=Cymbomonas tetramitiformis TaxID=36881 RepID=A0AAE0F6V5_9CHLO|nr:hypothetical protein CYMTET_36819 [Cymbomonas tetramitiformis]
MASRVDSGSEIGGRRRRRRPPSAFTPVPLLLSEDSDTEELALENSPEAKGSPSTPMPPAARKRASEALLAGTLEQCDQAEETTREQLLSLRRFCHLQGAASAAQPRAAGTPSTRADALLEECLELLNERLEEDQKREAVVQATKAKAEVAEMQEQLAVALKRASLAEEALRSERAQRHISTRKEYRPAPSDSTMDAPQAPGGGAPTDGGAGTTAADGTSAAAAAERSSPSPTDGAGAVSATACDTVPGDPAILGTDEETMLAKASKVIEQIRREKMVDVGEGPLQVIERIRREKMIDVGEDPLLQVIEQIRRGRWLMCGGGPLLQVIEQIRREKMVDVDVPEGMASQLEGLKAMLGRALSKLANDLYSSRSHFLMELVQNADDNTYPSGSVPTLEVMLCRSSVCTYNNEVGFQDMEVHALCNLGRKCRVAQKMLERCDVGA